MKNIFYLYLDANILYFVSCIPVVRSFILVWLYFCIKISSKLGVNLIVSFKLVVHTIITNSFIS